MTTHDKLTAVWARIEAEEGDDLEWLWLCFYRLLGAPRRCPYGVLEGVER